MMVFKSVDTSTVDTNPVFFGGKGNCVDEGSGFLRPMRDELGYTVLALSVQRVVVLPSTPTNSFPLGGRPGGRGPLRHAMKRRQLWGPLGSPENEPDRPPVAGSIHEDDRFAR